MMWKGDNMKILVINPNSSQEMTRIIEQNAKLFAQNDFQVDCIRNKTAPAFIGSYTDIALSTEGMLAIIKENEKKYDAFIIACYSDPNLNLLKEVSDKPVLGIGESSLMIASILGHKFSIIVASERGIPSKEVMVREYGLSHRLASIVATKSSSEVDWKDQENMIEAGRKIIKEDMSEVIILGCAGMGHVAIKMKEELGVPVLDGVTCALIIASGLVKTGISTSKIRRYKNN